MDLPRVERELKKRLPYQYRWGRKQSNSWDSDTNFIYQTYSFESLLKKTEQFSQELKDYALNRWYNFWSAMAAEDIFASHDNVIANKNSYDKLVDFTIDDIPFDHKTSIFPKGFNKSYEYAIENEKELIQWLYDNQSQQGRKHLKNRLFIIMYDKNNQHWKMKSEIMELKKEIDLYVDDFSQSNLYEFDFGDGKVYSDILWITKE
ncbi:hypothetical protein HOB87_01575 [Candidatus Woesearchaeota archaeon]|jgi:hypothetical protein|nr:hypothetical protein [Candidatus Woesearchaeota archaeon]MBT7556164.1 hypothetical protein [Candidatus Woesearchaeota archaeon]